jgi:hypothetical protein
MMKRCLMGLLVLLFSCSGAVFAAEPVTESRWALVIPTASLEAVQQAAGTNLLSFTVLGTHTVLQGGTTLYEQVKGLGCLTNSTPFRKGEQAWLLTTKDTQVRRRSFPGVRTVLLVLGNRVVLANETAKMGMASSMSDFSKIDPLPENEVVITPPRTSQRREPGTPMSELLKRLDFETYFAEVQAMADFKTRSTYTVQADRAIEYCDKIMQDLGLKTRRIPFTSSGSKKDNLEGRQEGFDPANAGEVLIVGHLDSTSPQASTLAPGADDNGSGAAGVLALARFMKGLNPRASIRYVLFLGEEQGLLGSKAYVASLQPAEIAKIRAVINMDMIGFDKTPPLSMVIETASFNKAMAELMSDLAAKHTALTSQISYNPWGSDHVPFLKKEIPTVLTIESEYDANPTYHKTNDTPEKLNQDLCREILKLNAATLVELASVIRSPR